MKKCRQTSWWQKLALIGGGCLMWVMMSLMGVGGERSGRFEINAQQIVTEGSSEWGEWTENGGSGDVSNQSHNEQFSPELNKFVKGIITAGAVNVLEILTDTEVLFNQETGGYALKMNGDGGVFAFFDQAFGTLTNIPISGAGYIATTLRDMNLNIAEPAYAQGFGYYSFMPLQEVWRVFRNLAYVFFTLVTVVVGLMILFQQRLDGQMTVTVQKALPRIILAIVMVTFSYAIAGALVDAMYLFMFMFGGLFNWVGDGEFNRGMGDLMGDSIFGLGGKMLGASITAMGSLWMDAIGGNMGNNFISTFQQEDFGSGVGQFFKFLFVDLILGFILGSVLWVIMLIVVIIATIVAMFKLLWELLKSYVSIILNVIFAPIVLMLGAFPWNEYWKGWFKAIVGHLSGFVTVFIIMTIYYVIRAILHGDSAIGYDPSLMGTANAAAQGDYLFTPPFIVPLLQDTQGNSTANQANIALAVLGLGMILILPELVKRTKKKMGAEQGFLGEMVGEMGKAIKDNPVTKFVGGAAKAGAGYVAGLAKGTVTGGIAGRWQGSRLARVSQQAEISASRRAISDARNDFAAGSITAAERDNIIATEQRKIDLAPARAKQKQKEHTSQMIKQERSREAGNLSQKMGGGVIGNTIASYNQAMLLYEQYNDTALNITNGNYGYSQTVVSSAQGWIRQYGYKTWGILPNGEMGPVADSTKDKTAMFTAWRAGGSPAPTVLVNNTV